MEITIDDLQQYIISTLRDGTMESILLSAGFTMTHENEILKIYKASEYLIEFFHHIQK